MPRQGASARQLANYMHHTPKSWRKFLVAKTKVVETQMCNNDWDNINFEHVPSVAGARYKKAFNRHTTAYAEYTQKLLSGEATVNANAIFPHQVLMGINDNKYSQSELNYIVAQWNALPNYMGSEKVLPMIDVSGSMSCPVGGNKKLQCIDVAVALGLYIADKNQGVFKDAFLTFHHKPKLQVVTGNIVEKVRQTYKAEWGGNTDIERAFEIILALAVQNRLPENEMPSILLILSDMQFDASSHSATEGALEMIKRLYNLSGYQLPKIVFWNLNNYDNVPVRYDEQGVAMVSGFSPSIMKAVLQADMEQFNPRNIMMQTIMSERYNIA